tara:strand:- start:2002 stop:3297 length:1296 start_codon:yes stop_codon:yes gene_type:complete
MIMDNLSALTAPLTLPAERLPNRLAKAAMTEGLADAYGQPTPAHARLYETWGRGGCGLLISGNVMVDRNHLEKPGNVIIESLPNRETRSLFQDWTRAARSGGAGFWMQLGHAGRQTFATVNPAPKAPSNVPLAIAGKLFGRPVPLSEPEILDIIDRFAVAAEVARETGFTGVQIHGAHGYLPSQFLSPLANRRTDAWGGPLENRARFLLEIVRAVRRRVGADFTLAVKLNSSDFQKGGLAFEESATVAGWLADASVDLLEISGGSYEQPLMTGRTGNHRTDHAKAISTKQREAYFLDFAAQMRRTVATPLMVTGGFRTLSGMAEAIGKDGISLVGIGRPLCVDPKAVEHLLQGREQLDRWEAQLRLGPGLLGPNSPIPAIRAINGFGAGYWFYQQIRRLAAGRPADLTLKLLSALKQERADQAAWLAKKEI